MGTPEPWVEVRGRLSRVWVHPWGACLVRTLVMTVDRDNDLGVKAGIRGPVIGRRNVLTAALRLGIADPEESDTNAILGALKQHDQLVELGDSGEKVEVAILTGDERVGLRSDRAVADQLEEVCGEFQPDRGVLVTDGAEDEALLPILQSRLPIDHVSKVIVKQSQGLEGTYYYIVKTLEDPKWRARMLLPTSIVLITIGLGVAFGIPWLIGSLPLVLGIYLLATSLGAEHVLTRIAREMGQNVWAAIASTMAWGAMAVSLILAAGASWTSWIGSTTQPGAVRMVMMVAAALNFIILAFFFGNGGYLALRLRGGTLSGRTLKLLAAGFAVWAIAQQGLKIAEVLLIGDTYDISVGRIWDDWWLPALSLVLFWVTRIVVNSFDQRQTVGERYWGI